MPLYSMYPLQIQGQQHSLSTVVQKAKPSWRALCGKGETGRRLGCSRHQLEVYKRSTIGLIRRTRTAEVTEQLFSPAWCVPRSKTPQLRRTWLYYVTVGSEGTRCRFNERRTSAEACCYWMRQATDSDVIPSLFCWILPTMLGYYKAFIVIMIDAQNNTETDWPSSLLRNMWWRQGLVTIQPSLIHCGLFRLRMKL